MRRSIVAILFAFVTTVFASGSAHAGGPFIVDMINNSGVPCQWLNNNLIWAYDEGDLSSSVDNEEAVQWLRDGFDLWMNSQIPDQNGDLIPTANVVHEEAGGVGGDIQTSDYVDYLLTEDYGTGAVIVFDEDGSIIEDYGYPSDMVLGLTLPTATDESGLYIIRGIILLNGMMLQYLPSDAEAYFKAGLLHEIGHLYNMDHDQVNVDIALACDLTGTCDGSQHISTMFPELKTYRQGTLSYDDKITLSWIYPNNSFKNEFCTIKGQVLDQDGNPLQGVNVLARYTVGTTMPLVDVRSMVSGVMYPACTADGHYYLHGLRPGRTYQVEYEPLTEEYANESGFEPFHGGDTPLPPSGFNAGTITKDGATSVECEQGGQVIEMDTVQIDVPNPCDTLTQPGGVGEEEVGVEEKVEEDGGGKCSLTMNSNDRSYLPYLVLFSAIVLIMLMRRRSCKR